MALRVCYVFLPNFFELGSREPLPVYYNLLYQYASYFPGYNFTIMPANQIGMLPDENSLTYNGCIGTLQKNESDMVVARAKLTDYGPDIISQGVIFNDYPMILSVYDKNEFRIKEHTRVLDFVNAYSPAHWLMTGLIMTSLCLLMILGIRMVSKSDKKWRNKRAAAFEDIGCLVTSSVLKQHSNCANVRMSSFLNYLYAFMTLLVFFTSFFLTSMIKTDMVIMNRPETYDTFQDLIEHGVTPIWLKEFNDHRYFKEARPGTNARRLWDRAMVKSPNMSVFSVTSLSMKSVPGLLGAAAKRELALIPGRASVNVAESNLCALARAENLLPNMNAYHSVDPETVEVLRVMLSRRQLPPLLMKRIRRVTSSSLEQQTFFTEVQKKLQFFIAPNKNPSQVEECMSSVITFPDHGIDRVTLYHYRDLAALFVALISFSLIVLSLEKMRNRRIRSVASELPVIRRRSKKRVPSLPTLYEDTP